MMRQGLVLDDPVDCLSDDAATVLHESFSLMRDYRDTIRFQRLVIRELLIACRHVGDSKELELAKAICRDAALRAENAMKVFAI